MCPEAPGVAGVTKRSPEGNEERRAPYTEVSTALPQRDLSSDILGRKHQDLLAKAFLLKMTVLRSVISFEDFDLERTFTFMHLADAFIQSDLQLHSGYTFSSVCVFPGNRTHNLLRCWQQCSTTEPHVCQSVGTQRRSQSILRRTSSS